MHVEDCAFVAAARPANAGPTVHAPVVVADASADAVSDVAQPDALSLESEEPVLEVAAADPEPELPAEDAA